MSCNLLHDFAEPRHLQEHLQICFGEAVNGLILANDHEYLETSLLEHLVHVFGGFNGHDSLFNKSLNILFRKDLLRGKLSHRKET